MNYIHSPSHSHLVYVTLHRDSRASRTGHGNCFVVQCTLKNAKEILFIFHLMNAQVFAHLEKCQVDVEGEKMPKRIADNMTKNSDTICEV